MVLSNNFIFSQTADKTIGCSPLEIKFSAPELSSYFWDFVEGNASSSLKDPIHIFTKPGTYKVKLYDGNKTKLIGEISIKVYADPIINFTADTTIGCTPFRVNFNSDVKFDPELKIVSYKWAFGDGGVAFDANPTHDYLTPGLFDVTLEVTFDILECKQSFTIYRLIRVHSVKADFIAEPENICANRGKIKIRNHTSDELGNTYFWDFGNSQFFNFFEPIDSVYYENQGKYDISLYVKSIIGCADTLQKTITIGKPIIDLIIPEIGCIYEYSSGLYNDPTSIINNTIADSFYVDFTPKHYNESISYKKVGASIIAFDLFFSVQETKYVTIIAYASNTCYSDTTFAIQIDVPNPQFTVSPLITCAQPQVVILSALDTTYSEYKWGIKGNYPFQPAGVDSLSQAAFIFKDAKRDTFYMNRIVRVYSLLSVTSKYGCKNVTQGVFNFNHPNARFATSNAQGCAPLEVVLTDSCTSQWKIISRKYTFGDGSTETYYTDDKVTHVFKNPGEYCVKLFIENELGCIDSSVCTIIQVGEPIIPDIEIDKTEVCLGDTVHIKFNNTDPRIDSYHIETGDGRNSNCWQSSEIFQVINTFPGDYNIRATIEYNGCFESDTTTGKLKVNGSIAELQFNLDCSKPDRVLFKNNSKNSDKSLLAIENNIYENFDQQEYIFNKPGKYNIILESIDTSNLCKNSIDSATIFITGLKAYFELPEKICDYTSCNVDAKNSTGIDFRPNQPYLWISSALPRPLKTNSNYFETTFPHGPNFVTLIVRDVNGCYDTLTKNIMSYGIDLNIKFEKDTFCVPDTIDVINKTKSDTTLIWNWFNGSHDRSPKLYYDKSYFYEFTNVWARVEDVLGCKDSFFTQLHLYKPESHIILLPGSNICVNDNLIFTAPDFTERGSSLDFLWTLTGIDTFYNKTNSYSFSKNGSYYLNLYYQEKSSGCSGIDLTRIDVNDRPIADFISDVDNDVVICYPKIITFTDKTKFDGDGNILWKFDNISLSKANNGEQTIGFQKGEHDITLIAQSFSGCMDTIIKNIKLIAPEGKITTDKSSICKGDSIKFVLFDKVDVNEYEWDFGDGITKKNVSPVYHTYYKKIDTTEAKIILTSAEGCHTNIEIPLLVNEVIADFEKVDTLSICEGYAYINNLSENANLYIWNVPDGKIQNDDNPLLVLYPGAGTYLVKLIVKDTILGCIDSIQKEISLNVVDGVFVIPNIFTPNGDGENDFFKPVILGKSNKSNLKFKTFKVFNRWGNLIYDNQSPQSGWDGKINGVLAPPDVYAYYLECDIHDCQTIKKKGNITLVR